MRKWERGKVECQRHKNLFPNFHFPLRPFPICQVCHDGQWQQIRHECVEFIQSGHWEGGEEEEECFGRENRKLGVGLYNDGFNIGLRVRRVFFSPRFADPDNVLNCFPFLMISDSSPFENSIFFHPLDPFSFLTHSHPTAKTRTPRCPFLPPSLPQ